MRVVKPFSLLWPDGASADTDRYRGSHGYIVDLDAPCEDFFLDGQMHKLVEITDEEIEKWEKRYKRKITPAVIKNPVALAAIRATESRQTFEPIEVAKKLKAKEEEAELAVEMDELGIPDPEPDPEPSDGQWGDA